jgi:hypothetical protein
MDIPALRYSRHARKHLVRYHMDKDDLDAIVWYPARRYVTHRGIEHEGWLSDGRPVRVVTDHSERVVITIVDLERRPRLRRYTR